MPLAFSVADPEYAELRQLLPRGLGGSAAAAEEARPAGGNFG